MKRKKPCFKGAELVKITRHNRPVAALIKWDRLEAIAETLEILSDPAAMKHIRAARAGKAKFTPLRDVLQELESGDAN